MAYDPYSPCPCGSGKKLKFCCQAIADDMERVNRLIEDNQLRAALKQLEALEKRQPSNEWVLTTRALILIESGESVAARDLLRPWVAAHPDSDFATVLYASAQLQAEGYDASKKSIQRAYQKGAKKFPSLVSGLAGAVAVTMMERRQAMAVRESLSLSLRFASEEDRQNIFVRLLEFDNNDDFYYPLRSVHPLPHVEVPAEHDKDYKRALKLAMIGCWDMAAETFSGLAEKLPDVGALRQSAGLCWAWDGDSLRAAAALHVAAQKLTDRALAVECEVLAQLLDLIEAKPTRALMSTDGEISSVSRLLSVLDDQPRIIRMPVPQDRQSTYGLTPSAIYTILDRPSLTEEAVPHLTGDTLPQIWAQVVIYDAQQDQPARAVISGLAGQPFDGAMELVSSVAGEHITWSKEPPESIDEYPLALDLFTWQYHFPPKTPLKIRHAIERQQWRTAIDDRWLNQPQGVLGNKSPADAAHDPALNIQTTAAVFVLDAICEQRRHSLDVPALLARLGLEPLPKLTLSADTSPNTLSVMQLNRLDVPSLSDPQLLSVANRALLIHHDAFLEPVLQEVLRRPSCLEQLDAPRVFQTLIDIAAQHGSVAEAIRWVDEVRRNLVTPQTQFEVVWQWDLRELMLRLTDPTDAELPKLLQKFAVYYGPKIPQLRVYLETILAEAGVESPWQSTGGIITSNMASSGNLAGGVWTPEGEAATAGGGKLWLPGQ